MKIVSEQFKNTLSELVRPATKLYFRIGNMGASHGSTLRDSSYLNLDPSVAPVNEPDLCLNEHYYAILGDDAPIDDPNRICAPDNPTVAPDNDTLPFGVSYLTPIGSYAMIGDNNPYYCFNFYNTPDDEELFKITFCFKGGHIPKILQVQVYDEENEIWVTEQNIANPDEDEEIVWTVDPSHFPTDETIFFRIQVKNSDAAGRFQLNYVKSTDYEERYVIFENTHISSIDISEEIDLTSQALPEYEMTVECLDVDEAYMPETEYWKDLFVEGAVCYLSVGYEFGDFSEDIPFFFGYLEKAPDYVDGKITFKVSSVLKEDGGWDWRLHSIPNKNLNIGDEVDSETFFNIIQRSPLFDNYDVFRDANDIANSKTNFYGEYEINEMRQLIANALGCYIAIDMSKASRDIHNTNDIQYKSIDDYMTRYEQIQNTLESQPKVGEIAITRNQNTLSSESVQRTLSERIYVHADEWVQATYNIPFFAIGKFVVNDYQKSVPSASVQADYESAYLQEVKPDGTVDVNINFWADTNTYLQPIVTFYGVKNTKFTETDADYEDRAGEKYDNNNDLITNSYVANKAKLVARMMNDIPNKYEVDVVQDYRYELGDVIRLETQKDTFKTCVITGLVFKLPASSGHLTCRKIFSLLDSSYAVIGAEGLTITCDLDLFKILKTSESGVVIGKYDSEEYTNFYMLGVSKYDLNGTEKTSDSELMDLNGHIWNFVYYRFTLGASIETNAPIIELPYDPFSTADEATYGAVNMLKKIYEDQGMTAPVDYTCILN